MTAVLLAAGTAWGQAAPDEDSIGEGPPPDGPSPVEFVPGEVVVETKAGEYETRKVDAQGLDSVKEAANRIKAQDLTVEEAGPNYVYSTEFVPNDNLFDHQDWLSTIRARGAWDNSMGTGVSVGVVDTGWQMDHPDLVDKVVAQRDFVSGDAVAEGYDYHGTAVAGIAAAKTNNIRGVASIGFDAGFLMAKACGAVGCKTEDTAPAIRWLALTKGVKIVNLSFGALYPDGRTDPILGDAVQDAQQAGALVVASAGNDRTYTDDHYPSCFSGVLGIGAIDDAGTKMADSNTGPCIDLVAPGESVLTTNDINDPIAGGTYYINTYGTSFAAPQVAGTAALIMARNSSLTADQIAARLQNRATDKGDSGRDDLYGYGLLNARCSVNPTNTGC